MEPLSGQIRAALLLLAGLAPLAVACGSDPEPTRIDVTVVEARTGLGRRLDRLELQVTALVPGEQPASSRETAPSYGDDGLRPWVVPVSPLEAAHAGSVLYRFRVIGYAAGAEVVRRQHRVTFVRGARLTLLMRLEPSCVAMPCADGADLTCVDGRCVDDYVPGCTVFPGTDVPAICASMDAAPRDAGAPDATDSGTGDAAELGVDAGDAGTDAAAPCGDAGPCSGGTTCCDDACVDPRTDPASCGSCGHACAARELCRAGACACEPGFADCDATQPGCETDVALDPAHCGGCGTRCEGATPACLGGTCGACTRDADCPADALPCTEGPFCLAGACEQPVTPGRCAIAGTCRDDGALERAGGCLVCRSSDSTTEWSPLPRGTGCVVNRCVDGATCDGGGACTGGVAVDCDDGLACTTDFCDPARSAGCEHRTSAGACSFDSACFAEGQWHPDGSCAVCSGGAWLPRPDGTACDDGRFCTSPDACASGRCTGPPTCPDDRLDCTDECNEATDRCETIIRTGRCLIGGACYYGGQFDPTDVCRSICASDLSQTSWTVFPSTDGFSCALDQICAAGACVPCPAGRHDCTGAIGGCECADPSRCSAGACVPP